MPLLTTRAKFFIGTWNREDQPNSNGMRRYNLAVLGISETHWTQARQKSLATGEMLLYSGHEEENAPHTQGVALMLSKVARNALIALNNRFQALQDLLKDEETSMEDNWKGIKEALTSTCHEVLGLKKYHHKEWISTETLDKIKERKNEKAAINNSRTRAEKVQAQAEYIEANKQVKRSIRSDKKKYVEELATTMGKAAREGNMKRLDDTTKKLAGKYSKPERPVKDDLGFADDLALLSHTHEKMETKSASVAAVSASEPLLDERLGSKTKL
ncbi:unnamed protein product [Schistosoma margrebowiei]|uniref:Uncharacterized protein n=1 Tax=Schistosoma margrebowiei TaxID=48269 RepID=A0A183LQY8_9TREM|nr:unnamed protein product [Schistosoma margrebowiei]